jgi:hypothetical protein
MVLHSEKGKRKGQRHFAITVVGLNDRAPDSEEVIQFKSDVILEGEFAALQSIFAPIRGKQQRSLLQVELVRLDHRRPIIDHNSYVSVIFNQRSCVTIGLKNPAPGWSARGSVTSPRPHQVITPLGISFSGIVSAIQFSRRRFVGQGILKSLARWIGSNKGGAQGQSKPQDETSQYWHELETDAINWSPPITDFWLAAL